MKHKIRYSCVTLLVVVLLIQSGCSRNDQAALFSAEQEFLTLDEALTQAYCVAVASVDSIIEGDETRKYKFSLEESLKGEFGEEVFYVTEGYGEFYVEEMDHAYSTTESQFEKGKRYLLVLSKMSSVYFEEDKYMNVADVCIELDENNKIIQSKMYKKQLENSYRDLDGMKKRIVEINDTAEPVKAFGVPFTDSEDLTEIVPASQYIVQVSIESISIESSSNRDTYNCRVTDTLKGETAETIQAVLFKDTVEIGGDYILLLNKESDVSLLYTLSSKVSAVSLSEKDRLMSLIK